MKEITILLTRVGSLVTPSYINALRSVKERKIKIIGVDADEEGIGQNLVDKFFKVNKMSEKETEYCNEILEISKKENVDAVLPTDEAESIAFRKRQNLFNNIKTVLACPDLKTLNKLTSKKDFYNNLHQVGLPYPKFFVANNYKDIKIAAEKLGYPKKEVVIKPTLGVAERGFRILSEKKDRLNLLYNYKPAENLYISLTEFKEIVKDRIFPETIVSEYLSGDREYSVDTISNKGKMLFCVPKLRIKTILGASSIGKVSMKQDIQEETKKIIELLKLNSNINIQFKENKENKLIPYEANPRIAGTIALCNYAGANLIYYGIKLALGEKLPHVRIRDGAKIHRYLNDYFPPLK